MQNIMDITAKSFDTLYLQPSRNAKRESPIVSIDFSSKTKKSSENSIKNLQNFKESTSIKIDSQENNVKEIKLKQVSNSSNFKNNSDEKFYKQKNNDLRINKVYCETKSQFIALPKMEPNSIPEAEPQLNKKLINVPEIITIDLPSKGGLPKELISSSNNALCLTSLKSKSDLQIIPCDKKEMLKNVSSNERSDLKYSPEVSNISHLLHTPEIINSEMSTNQKLNSNLHKISRTEKLSSTTCDNIRIDPIVKKTVNAVLNKPFKLVECESSKHSVILPSVKKVQIPSNFNFLHKNSNLCIKKLDAENETDESEVQIVFEKKKVGHFVNLKDSNLCVKKINSEKINKFSKPKDFKLERKKVNFQENTKMSIVSPEKEISHESISKKLISVNILENTKKINAESSIKFSNHELHFRSERKKENFRDNIKSTCINELKQPVCSLKCDTQFTSLKKDEDTINDLHDKKRNEYKSRSLVEYESQLASKSLNDIFNLSGVKNQDIFLPYVLIEKLPDVIYQECISREYIKVPNIHKKNISSSKHKRERDKNYEETDEEISFNMQIKSIKNKKNKRRKTCYKSTCEKSEDIAFNSLTCKTNRNFSNHENYKDITSVLSSKKKGNKKINTYEKMEKKNQNDKYQEGLSFIVKKYSTLLEKTEKKLLRILQSNSN